MDARRARGRRQRGLNEHYARELLERRDSKPTVDTRQILKAAVAGTFDLTAAQLAWVFPGSESAGRAYDLMR